MSTNHNRIKVSDLETNERDKILKTNMKGELEFSDISNLKTENYNDLDCNTEGKALDARQGKVLKDMIDNGNVSPPSLVNDLTTGGTSKALTAEMGKTLENTKLTASLASDPETQIIAAITEDKKVITRLKLFNWWIWIKSQVQTISGAWSFTNKVTLASGTINTPPLIIPNGTLTNTAQNGAIERDTNGQLWETHNNLRSRLFTTSDGFPIIYKSTRIIETIYGNAVSGTSQNISTSLAIGTFSDISMYRFNTFTQIIATLYEFTSSNNIKPTLIKSEIFLKVNNGIFGTTFSGTNPVNQVKIAEYNGLNNNGYQNYQNILIFDHHNPSSIDARWSNITFPEHTIDGNSVRQVSKTYYLRDAANTKTLGASEASFSIVFLNSVEYNDKTNSAGLNANTVLRTENRTIFIENMK